jgi:hypothetical protein
MSHETLPLDEVVRRAQWVVDGFKQEDVDRVSMRPNQGFEPLVSVVFLVLSSPSFLGLVDLTHRVSRAGSVCGQGVAAVDPRGSHCSTGEASLRGLGEEGKKKRCNRKIHEREALLKCCRQQWLEGLPEEESPSETASEKEDDDSDDNDAGSWYDTTTFLAYLCWYKLSASKI